METQYYKKYLKYKTKYIKLKQQIGMARKHSKRPRYVKETYDEDTEDYDNNYDDNNYDDDTYDEGDYDDNINDKLKQLPKPLQKCLKQLNLSNFTDNPDVMNIIAQYLQNYLQQYGKDFISNPQNLKKIFKKIPKFI